MDADSAVAAPARALGGALARYLAQPRHVHGTSAPGDLGALAGLLRPADVILVEGASRFSTAVKYLTQSTWSHAALYVGDRLGTRDAAGARHVVVEADVAEGVRAVPLAQFAGLHLRVCRPVGLTDDEAAAVIDHAAARLGHRYDLRNVFDLLRYLFPTPPVPLRWRRRLLAHRAAPGKRPAVPGVRRRNFSCAPSQPVRAARLRRLAVLRGRETHLGGRLRPSGAAMG
jgi:hypothetical protein